MCLVHDVPAFNVELWKDFVYTYTMSCTYMGCIAGVKPRLSGDRDKQDEE